MDLLRASPSERSAAVKALGRAVGFDDVGVASPGPHPEMAHFAQWLERGFHGEMGYMYRHRRRRMEPARVQTGLRSVIVSALDYDTSHPRSTEVPRDPERGWISRYAWGDDYHHVVEPMLDDWVAGLSAAAPGHAFRRYVDHGPVLEKVFARYGGIGWMGKHTNIIHPTRGSWFFLAVILTDLELAEDAPIPDHCGTCTACLDACPTDAFPEPYVLDATRCLSYLNIELNGSIPSPHDRAVGHQVYGCDICQDVCPWNRKPEPPDRSVFQPRDGLFHPLLDSLEDLEPEEFEVRFARSPIARRGPGGLSGAVRAVRQAQGGVSDG